MRAIDTNVLVRLIARDDDKQVAAAEAFVKPGAWVSHVVLVETTWVLESVYDVDAARIADGIEMLLGHEHVVLQDAGTVEAALDQFRRRPALGFSDCLVVEIARKAGHVPLGTFDKALAKLDDVEKL